MAVLLFHTLTNHALYHKKVEYFTLSKFIKPETWMVLFGFDNPTHNLPHEYTKFPVAQKAHPLLYCICVYNHAGGVTHPHVKSRVQFHPVLVAFAICPDKQFKVAVDKVFIFIPVPKYQFRKKFPVEFIRSYVLFQLFAPERLITPVTAFAQLTYIISILFPLLKFIPVV